MPAIEIGWRLAPAYDLIYAYNPSGAWTHRHQMTLNGKRDEFLTGDLPAAAEAANVKPPKAKEILREIHAAASQWRNHAEAAGVSPDWIREIQANLRLDLTA